MFLVNKKKVFLEQHFFWKESLLKYKDLFSKFLIKNGEKKKIQNLLVKDFQQKIINLKSKNKFIILKKYSKIFNNNEFTILIKEKQLSKKKKWFFFQPFNKFLEQKYSYNFLKRSLKKKNELKNVQKLSSSFLELYHRKKNTTTKSEKNYFEDLVAVWNKYGRQFKTKKVKIKLKKTFTKIYEKRVLIKFQSFDSNNLDYISSNLSKWILLNFKQDFKFSFIKLPKKYNKYTVLRSPHVNKTARDQFELITHSLICVINISNTSNIEDFFKNFYKYISQFDKVQIKVKTILN